MLYHFRRITTEQLYMITVFVLSVILSFLYGYTLFRYWQIEVCKPVLEIVEQN